MARELAPDWILKETLAIQDNTAQWFKDKVEKNMAERKQPTTEKGEGEGLSMAFLGCGIFEGDRNHDGSI